MWGNYCIKLFILFCFLGSPLKLQADDNSIIIGDRIKIFSKILNEDRTIFVSLPDEYDDSQQYYPVLYQLDGCEPFFYYSTGIIRYFEAVKSIPSIIVVSISNRVNDQDMRNRDMLPIKNKNIPESGGGDNFLKFIIEELVPFVDKNFRTSPTRILFGESNSALFTIYTLLTKPEIFDVYIASSPPFAWETYFLVEKAKTVFKEWAIVNKFLFVSYGGKETDYIRDGIPLFANVLNNLNPTGLKWKFKDFKYEGHCPPTTLHDALRAYYSNWSYIPYPEMIPTGGHLNNGETISVILKSEYKNVRYTLDGREPTRNSFLYSKPIEISNPLILKAKAFAENKCESKTIIGYFKNTDTELAIKNLTDIKEGLHYKYYEGMWDKMPNFAREIPKKSGVTRKIKLDDEYRKIGFALEFNGYIKIPQQGTYRFYLQSDDGSQLSIGDQIVIENNGSYPHVQKKSWQHNLEAGFHPISIKYFQYLGNQYLDLKLEGPNMKIQPIPRNMLYYSVL